MHQWDEWKNRSPPIKDIRVFLVKDLSFFFSLTVCVSLHFFKCYPYDSLDNICDWERALYLQYFSMIIFPCLTKAFLCDAFLENLKVFFGKFPRLKSQIVLSTLPLPFNKKPIRQLNPSSWLLLLNIFSLLNLLNFF